MYKDLTPEEHYYQQRSMRASGLVQAIWQSGNVPKEEAFAVDYVENMFKASIKIIEAYVIKEPFKSPYQLGSPPISTGNQHLSDEKVADGLRPPYDPNVVPKESQVSNKERQFVFASEKQCNRVWAIACSNGWIINKQPLPQFRSLCQSFGFQNSKKIPVEVYNSFIKALEMGLQPQESSAHLQ